MPDVFLLGLDLGCGSGLDIIPQLVSLHEKLRVLILTGVRGPELQRRAIRPGAAGIVMKERGGETLIKAIRRIIAGEVWVDRSRTALVLEELRRGSEGRRLDARLFVRIPIPPPSPSPPG